MFDCHMHSYFSGDSKMDPIDACNTAIKLGLEGITFTDHQDFDYPDEFEFIVDLDAYSPFMDNLKAKFDQRLKILKGIEVGIQPHIIEQITKVINNYDFDYVLGSIHLVNRLDPGNPKHDFFNGVSQQEAYESYLKEIHFMVTNFDSFDALGHIDYIRRYGRYDVRLLLYNDFSDIIDSILKELISKGKGMEVNAGGFKSKLSPPLLDINILKRYKELGGEILCTGSDAHAIANIGDHFGEVMELISHAGFKYIAHFEKRKPVFDKI